MKAATFGLLLFSVLALLFCLLSSGSGQLKDVEFRLIVPLLASLALLLVAFVLPDGYDKDDRWEPL